VLTSELHAVPVRISGEDGSARVVERDGNEQPRFYQQTMAVERAGFVGTRQATRRPTTIESPPAQRLEPSTSFRRCGRNRHPGYWAGEHAETGLMADPIAARPGDLLAAAVRAEVANVLSAYPLAQIRQLFATEGFREPAGFELTQGSMRRSLVTAVDDGIDFGSPAETQRYLRVVERILEDLDDTAKTGPHPWASESRTKILRELRRAGINPDTDGRLIVPSRIAASPSLAAAPDETGIRLAIAALERSGTEPEERIGAAKELVEATIKFSLEELKEAYGRADDLGALAKQLHARLRLDPSGIAPTTKGADSIIRILRGLTSIPAGLAELRNAGYGTGHGQSRRISGIKPRHADLAARSAIAYASFVLDTLADPAAPWREP
jgi:hypothetical protein